MVEKSNQPLRGFEGDRKGITRDWAIRFVMALGLLAKPTGADWLGLGYLPQGRTEGYQAGAT